MTHAFPTASCRSGASRQHVNVDILNEEIEGLGDWADSETRERKELMTTPWPIFKIEVSLIYNVLINAVQQSGSVMHMYTVFAYVYNTHVCIVFHYALSQDIGYSSTLSP